MIAHIQTVQQYLQQPRDEIATELPSTGVNASAPRYQRDDTLRRIFVAESGEQLARIQRYMAARVDSSGGLRLDDKLLHLLHTLNGGAQAAEVEPMSALSKPLEQWLDCYHRMHKSVPAIEMGLLRKCLSTLQVQLTQVESGESLASEHAQKLATELAALVLQSEKETHTSPGPANSELREVFVDEASDLLASMEVTLQHWCDAPADRVHSQAFKRGLHTLKGSARMSGVQHMADLSHAMESAIASLEHRSQQPDGDSFSLYQRVLDQLHAQVDQVAVGQACADAEDLLQSLHNEAGREKTLEEDREADSVTEHAAVPPKVEPQDVQSPGDSETAHQALSIAPLPSSDEEALVVDSLAIDSNALSEPVAEVNLPDVVSEEPPSAFDALQQRTLTQMHNLAQDSGVELDGGASLRVDGAAVSRMIRRASEVNVLRARLTESLTNSAQDMSELGQTVQRLREQLRQMDQETEAQILHGARAVPAAGDSHYDPLELDRYSRIQELSRRLLESVADLEDIHETLHRQLRITRTTLDEQGSVGAQLQDELTRTQLVEFSTVVARLERVIRQTANDADKVVELRVEGADQHLDRNVLQGVLSAIEHLLRNAVVHGIESAEARAAAGKQANGSILIKLAPDAGDMTVRVIDDGAGIDLARVRQVAEQGGLITPDMQLADDDLAQLLLVSGFTTATTVTQDAGRGVGLDVVNRELKQLGGSLSIQSQPGVGSSFALRLPQALAITPALMVRVLGETFAVPLKVVAGINYMGVDAIQDFYIDPDTRLRAAGESYKPIYLGDMLAIGDWNPADAEQQMPLVLLRVDQQHIALHVDQIVGRHELAVKPAGGQFRSLRAFAGASILADGQVVPVLDMVGLSLDFSGRIAQVDVGDETQIVAQLERGAPSVLVVDDSVTIRKVTTRMLERHGFQVSAARDGIEALAAMRRRRPDVVLLDVEMPRMDGFELAARVRADHALSDLPLVMITSRTGQKHRDHAASLGVQHYLGKPYQETQLLAVLRRLVSENEVCDID